jgi:hypothetical protein
VSRYDSWRTAGNAHRCVCGVAYYDSDDGPCHYRCGVCGEMHEIEEDCPTTTSCPVCDKRHEEGDNPAGLCWDCLSQHDTEEEAIEAVRALRERNLADTRVISGSEIDRRLDELNLGGDLTAALRQMGGV